MSQNMYGKEKTLRAHDSTNLTSSISVYCRSNVKSHAGWSTILCHLSKGSENECSEQISENFRNGIIFRRQKFFVGNKIIQKFIKLALIIRR